MEQVFIDNISKSYGTKRILSGGSISLKTGEIIGLFGRNGTGKSTLFSVLFGTTLADSIFFKHNEKVLLNRFHFKKVFSLSTQFIFLPEMNVTKLIKLFLGKITDDFTNDDLIRNILNKKVSELSFGTKKYLQTKLILFNEQPFCLLDEPYSGLSPIMTDKINQLIQGQSTKKGIIISDHDYLSVLEITTQNYILKNGALYGLKHKDELKDYGYLGS